MSFKLHCNWGQPEFLIAMNIPLYAEVTHPAFQRCIFNSQKNEKQVIPHMGKRVWTLFNWWWKTSFVFVPCFCFFVFLRKTKAFQKSQLFPVYMLGLVEAVGLLEDCRILSVFKDTTWKYCSCEEAWRAVIQISVNFSFTLKKIFQVGDMA